MTIVPALDLRSAEPHPNHTPSNIEAEQALLGAVLFDNAAYERLSDQLKAQHFHEPFHQRLFAAMEEYIRKGQLAEPIVLMERFRRDPAFEELGGLRYLADLVDRAMVVLDKPIKTLGLHEIKIRLHAEVTLTVTINIARSQDEAERQARGENVISSQFDEDRAAAEEAAADMLEGGAGSHEVDFGADR